MDRGGEFNFQLLIQLPILFLLSLLLPFLPFFFFTFHFPCLPFLHSYFLSQVYFPALLSFPILSSLLSSPLFLLLSHLYFFSSPLLSFFVLQVLVMDKGTVAEYDSPSNLLAIRDSMFSKLVNDWESSSHSDESE